MGCRTLAPCAYFSLLVGANAMLVKAIFQRTLPPKKRCNQQAQHWKDAAIAFQSSPPPQRRCNISFIHPIMYSLEFQSSSSPQRRCNGHRQREFCARPKFQSSPPPKWRCNALAAIEAGTVEKVFQSSPRGVQVIHVSKEAISPIPDRSVLHKNESK